MKPRSRRPQALGNLPGVGARCGGRRGWPCRNKEQRAPPRPRRSPRSLLHPSPEHPPSKKKKKREKIIPILWQLGGGGGRRCELCAPGHVWHKTCRNAPRVARRGRGQGRGRGAGAAAHAGTGPRRSHWPPGAINHRGASPAPRGAAAGAAREPAAGGGGERPGAQVAGSAAGEGAGGQGPAPPTPGTPPRSWWVGWSPGRPANGSAAPRGVLGRLLNDPRGGGREL